MKFYLDLADKHDVKILAQNETFIPKKKMLKFKILLPASKTEKEFLRLLVKVLGKEKVLNDHYYVQNPEELKQTFRQFPDAFEAYTNFYKNLNLIL